jgi:hypothetical protein
LTDANPLGTQPAQEDDYSSRIAVAKASVFQHLDRLQFGSPGKLLLMKQDPVGLGAQISRRVLGLRLGLHYDRTVVFVRDDDWPYAQSFERQYSSEILPPVWADTPDFDFDDPDGADVARFNFWKWWDNPKKDTRFLEAAPHGLTNIPEASRIYDGILLCFLRLCPSMESYVAEEASRLKVDDGVIGVHVRRGDKKVETPYIGIDVISANIQRLVGMSGRTRVFLATDDPDVYGRLLSKAKANYEIIYDASEPRYNNANHRLLMKRPELADIETRTAIKNIMILAKCHMVLGQTNAHFASLAASMICARRCTADYGYLIPGDHALRTSPIRKALFWIGKQPRKFAKMLLPSYSVRSRGGD